MKTNKSEWKEVSYNDDKAHLKSLVFILPLIIFFASLYYFIWNQNITEQLSYIVLDNVFSTILILILGIICHELIHGLFWSFFVKDGFKSIKFGLSKSSYAPYCHCKETMNLWQYIIGSIMPAVLLGFLPLLIGLISGNFTIFFVGLILLLGAGSDVFMIWKLRKESPNHWVLDHPDKIGCIIYKNKPAAE